MKKLFSAIPYIFIMCGIFFFSFSFSQNGKPFIHFKESKYNFGFVKQGKVVKIEYDFTNTGKEPLIISNIEVTCGCTVAEFPHYPINSGESGMILITFNTKEKEDRQDRTVNVISNASNSPTKLRFKGVITKNKEQKEK